MNNIPSDNASWEEIVEYALSFNGYSYVNGGPKELDALWDRAVINPKAATIKDLRACLFLLQRAGRFCGDGGSSYDIEESRAIIQLIKNKMLDRS